MAMRPSSTGGIDYSSRQRARAQPVYEDFKPMSEWIQDQESDILLIYLPGFIKENLKVTTESKNIIRVRGERLISGNKWNRLMEDYRVPNDCNLQGTRAKFQGGILTVKVPKKTTAPPPLISPKDDASPTQEQASMAPKTPKDDLPKAHQNAKPVELPMPQEEDTSEALVSQKMLSEAKTEKGRDKEDQTGYKGSTTRLKDSEHAINQDATTCREGSEAKGKPEKSELGKDGGLAQADESDEYAEAKANQATNATASGSTTTYHGLEKCKQSLKGLMELDEVRQLLVNVGVAVLIIVAIGTYCFYYRSRK